MSPVLQIRAVNVAGEGNFTNKVPGIMSNRLLTIIQVLLYACDEANQFFNKFLSNT